METSEFTKFWLETAGIMANADALDAAVRTQEVNVYDCVEVPCSVCDDPDCDCRCHTRHEQIDQAVERDRGQANIQQDGGSDGE
jgi:hypothetical protein